MPLGRPQPRGLSVRWGPSRLPKKGAEPPNFRPMRPTAEWIKMPFGTEVDLGPDDTVSDGDPAPPPQKGAEPPPNFWPMSIAAKRLDG